MKKLEYVIVKLLYESLRRIPFRWSIVLARIMQFTTENIVRYRRKVILGNLQMTYPDKTKNELNSLVKKIYKNFSYLWIEILQTWRLNQDFAKKNFTVHNWEIVEQALSEGHGLILLTGHMGNFEWPVHYCMMNLKQVYAIMKKLTNPYVNDLIVGIRESTSGKMIFKKQALKRGLQILKQGDILVVVTDQDAGKQGIDVEFLGWPASTATGTAIFHLKTGAPMIFVTGIRRKFGVFDIYFEKIPDYQPPEFSNKSIRDTTISHTEVLDKWVRRYPEQYFWTHKRWKTSETVITGDHN